MAMFAALWRWLWSEETPPKRNIVKLKDIPTWTDLYYENKEAFASTLSGIKESPHFPEDPDINRKVSMYGADMTELEVDGIVRSTNSNLTAREGISGAIRRSAGSRLDAELKAIGGCNPGEAKTTSGCDLPAKYIVHTVGTNNEQPEVLESCYRSCLEQMRLNNMKSLAFCCISTGIDGYPIDKAVLVALRTVRFWLEELKNEHKLNEVDRIVFCFFSDADDLLYRIWMQSFFPSTYEPEPTTFATGAQISSPEENAATGYSGPTGEHIGDNIASVEDAVGLEQKKKRELRPLPVFIELTTEPDMMGLDDDDPNAKRAKMPCGHVIGFESMTAYCRDILNNGKYKFICPSPKCDYEWEYFLVRHVAGLSDEEMHEFEQTLEKNFLQKEQGNQRCPGCQTWCTRVPGTGNRVRCPICPKNRGKKFDFCWICLNEWKRFLSTGSCGNLGCDGRDKRIHILATCLTKKIDYCLDCPIIRGCQKCGILIEHKDKCGHVYCRNCHTGFCFICLKEKKYGEWQCKPYLNTCKLAPRQSTLPGSQ